MQSLNAVKWLLFMNPKLCAYSSLLQYFGFSHNGECRKRGKQIRSTGVWQCSCYIQNLTHTLQTRQLTHAILLDITCTAAIQTRMVAAYVYSCGVHHLPRSSLETTDFHTSLSSSICQDFMAQESCTVGFHFVRHSSWSM